MKQNKVLNKTSKRKQAEKLHRNSGFGPFRLISDKEFCANMDAIIAYYQALKGESRRRFESSYWNVDEQHTKEEENYALGREDETYRLVAKRHLRAS
ncbi:MAG: hypothetical protein ACOC7U_09445 [Spirochaetota bacterium]